MTNARSIRTVAPTATLTAEIMQSCRRSSSMLAKSRMAFAALTGLALANSTATATADPVEDFYKGKTLRMIIAFGVGGGYDLYARAAAENLGRFIPGKPMIVPQNMPGGGGFVAAKYMFGAAPRDGTVLGVLAQSLALDSAIQSDKAGVNIVEMPYIGRMTSSVEVGHGMPGAKFSTFEDARRTEIVAGSSGTASPTFIMPAALNKFAGAKFKIVTGYAGVTEITLAAERGEVQFVGSGSLTVLMTKNPNWITQKNFPILYQAALKRDPLIPDVPTLGELGLDDEGKSVLRLIASSGDFGRAVNTTPGLPKERLAALRKAFVDMIQDPEFRAKMAERKIDIQPGTGEALDEIARNTVSAPQRQLDQISGLSKK